MAVVLFLKLWFTSKRHWFYILSSYLSCIRQQTILHAFLYIKKKWTSLTQGLFIGIWKRHGRWGRQSLTSFSFYYKPRVNIVWMLKKSLNQNISIGVFPFPRVRSLSEKFSFNSDPPMYCNPFKTLNIAGLMVVTVKLFYKSTFCLSNSNKRFPLGIQMQVIEKPICTFKQNMRHNTLFKICFSCFSKFSIAIPIQSHVILNHSRLQERSVFYREVYCSFSYF